MSASPTAAGARSLTPSFFVRLRGWLRAIFVDVPDPVRPTGNETNSPWATLLAWPIRLLAVAGATLIGWIWSGTPGGVQLGWALQYTMFAAVAVVTSFWFWILLANVSTAALWVARCSVAAWAWARCPSGEACP